MDENAPAALRVTLLYSPEARVAHEWEVTLVPGSSVRQALQASGALQRFAELGESGASVGIWGRKAGWDQPLHEGDRVEFYRALQVDPKVARRERFRKQGARATGLFAKRRKGAKPGY